MQRLAFKYMKIQIAHNTTQPLQTIFDYVCTFPFLFICVLFICVGYVFSFPRMGPDFTK